MSDQVLAITGQDSYLSEFFQIAIYMCKLGKLSGNLGVWSL
jgi:hypothetical protein